MRRWTYGAVVALVAVVTLGSGLAYRAHQAEARTRSEYAPVATIKDIMDSIVDPSADDVWNSVMTTVDHGGEHEVIPQTEDDWMRVRRGTIRLLEAGNLLLMPERHVARTGEKSDTPGIELEPGEMELLINQNRQAWVARVKAFRDVSQEVLRTVDARDGEKLFAIGARIDETCESCHRQYWYPNEKIPEFPTDPSKVQTIGANLVQ